MKVYVVVEGETEAYLLRAVLPNELLSHLDIVRTGGGSNLVSVARSLLVTRRRPLAVLVDTDSTDERIVREKKQSTEELLKAVSAGVPTKVILLIPEVEILLFDAPGLLANVFGHQLPNEVLILARNNPKEALSQLIKGQKELRSIHQLLDRLTDEGIEALRSTGPIRELMEFLKQVATSPPQTTIA